MQIYTYGEEEGFVGNPRTIFAGNFVLAIHLPSLIMIIVINNLLHKKYFLS